MAANAAEQKPFNEELKPETRNPQNFFYRHSHSGKTKKSDGINWAAGAEGPTKQHQSRACSQLYNAIHLFALCCRGASPERGRAHGKWPRTPRLCDLAGFKSTTLGHLRGLGGAEARKNP